MPYTAAGYARRAAECARIASMTQDQMVQADLLRLRQTYLSVAERLGMPLVEALAIAKSVSPTKLAQ
jgi:hypothetical protein